MSGFASIISLTKLKGTAGTVLPLRLTPYSGTYHFSKLTQDSDALVIEASVRQRNLKVGCL